ncbi:hypothetical protein H310_15310 [Aphanomyces invadans]|uniref:DDE-1 domain-containing protein n=1 Tax=Aphanomyces invadans TaxID=157072 RepID=A0A024T8E5_9STRA|nr:hypothetical protein H310_15310 [Aphanomyces invadans]ETV89851.1 hypothetical protein H310_15310 [Aphanomyces invadans]|eukprot:XP_008881517.1 hypothetical protein H310_15310 [Aphanomyces invadans]
MRPLKSALCHQWIEYLRTELQSHTSGPCKLSPPNRFDLVEWVHTAWEKLPQRTIICGFRKCKIIDGPVDAGEGNECAAVLDTKSYKMIE